MLRDLINHDPLPSVRKKKLIRPSASYVIVFKDPPVLSHIAGKLCAVISENGVQVHHVHSPFLFPRNALIKYDTMSSNAHISNAVSRFFLDSSSIYPDLRRIDEERKSLRGISGDKARPRRPAFFLLHSKRKNFVKYILFETLKLVC